MQVDGSRGEPSPAVAALAQPFAVTPEERAALLLLCDLHQVRMSLGLEPREPVEVSRG